MRFPDPTGPHTSSNHADPGRPRTVWPSTLAESGWHRWRTTRACAPCYGAMLIGQRQRTGTAGATLTPSSRRRSCAARASEGPRCCLLARRSAPASPGCSTWPDVADWDWTGSVDTSKLPREVFQMPKPRSPYAAEFRRQMIDLVRAGRDPDDLARELEPTAKSSRNWAMQQMAEALPGLVSTEPCYSATDHY